MTYYSFPDNDIRASIITPARYHMIVIGWNRLYKEIQPINVAKSDLEAEHLAYI